MRAYYDSIWHIIRCHFSTLCRYLDRQCDPGVFVSGDRDTGFCFCDPVFIVVRLCIKYSADCRTTEPLAHSPTDRDRINDDRQSSCGRSCRIFRCLETSSYARLALALGPIAQEARITRSSMTEISNGILSLWNDLRRSLNEKSCPNIS